MKNYIFLRGMKRKRDLKDEICIAIKDCDLSEFKKLLHESPGVIYNHCDTLLLNVDRVLTVTAYGDRAVDVQKEILRIIIQHEQFDSLQIMCFNSSKHISWGAFALYLASNMTDFECVKLLLTLGVDPNAKIRGRHCGVCFNVGDHNVENAAKCLEYTIEHGLDIDQANYKIYTGPCLFVVFIYAQHVSGIRMLLRYGTDITNWTNWCIWNVVKRKKYFYDDEKIDEIHSMLNNHKSYLPIWTPRIQRRYPQEFHDIAVNGLSLFKRLNVRANANICPDMRRLLISYIADEWKKK